MSAGELPIGIEFGDNGAKVLPSERFKDAQQVKELCNSLIQSDSKRINWRRSINGLIDGNPPYSAASLRAKGQGWRARVNYREAEAVIAQQSVAYYDLVTAVDNCIEVDLDYGKGQDQIDWQDSIQRNFTWLLFNRWREGFNHHLQLCQREMLIHGIGAHVWPNASWIPRTPKSGMLLFPEDAPSNFKEGGKYCMLRDFVPGEDVYGFIRNEKAAGKLGWDVENTWKALALSSKTNRQPIAGNQSEIFQREMQRGDLGYSNSRQAGLWLNHMFVTEYDGLGISHYIIAEGNPETGYLYKRRLRFKDWGEVMQLFLSENGDGSLHSIRGLGTKVRDFFELSNRLKNSMADQVFLSGLLMFKGGTGVDPDKLRLMKLGMLGIVPQQLEQLQPFKFADLSQGALPLDQLLQTTVRENNKGQMGGLPDPKDRETAQSFNLRAMDSAQVNNGAHSLYGSNLKGFYERTLRGVLKQDSRDSVAAKMANEMKERCKKDGVPEAAFSKIVEIREIMGAGAGSAAARQHSLMTLFQTIYPTTSPDRQINIERDIVGSMFPGNKVDRYARNLKDNDQATSDDSMIAVENDVLGRGGKAVVSPRQNQPNHIKGHLAAAQAIVAQVQQGQMDPQAGLTAIQGIGQHVQAHLDQLKNNPQKKGEYEQARRELLSLASIADQLHQQIEESQSQEPPQQQVSDNLQIGMAKVQADSQVKQAKFQVDTSLKFRKEAANQRLKDLTTAAQLHRDTQTHQLTQEHKQLALTNGQ